MNSQFERYNDYLASLHWANLREDKFSIVGKKCQYCQSKRIVEVHHVHYRNLTDCTVEDLIVFCQKCHGALHSELARKKLKPQDAELPLAFELIRLHVPSKKTREVKKSKKQNRGMKKERRALRRQIRDQRIGTLTRKDVNRAIGRMQACGYSLESVVRARDILNILIKSMTPPPINIVETFLNHSSDDTPAEHIKLIGH